MKSQFMQRLGLDLPLVLGPFGGGLSRVELSARVSTAGGLGSFGAHHLEPEDILDVARRLRAATPGPFALNLWISNHDAGADAPDEDTFEEAWRRFEPWFVRFGLPRPPRPARTVPRYEDQVAAVLEAQPAVFSFVFGIPSRAVLEQCRRRGIVTVGAATSIDEGLCVQEAGVDAVVASGFEAGGHRPSFLARAEESLVGSFALTRLLASKLRIPVIAAGGIADAAGIRAARALGAQAAQIGTAFLACRESGASDVHRAALFGDGARHTTLTRAFSGRLARGLRNAWTAAHAPAAQEIAPYPLQGWFAAQLRQAALAAGRDDLVAMWSGQIAPLLQHREAAALLQSLQQELATA